MPMHVFSERCGECRYVGYGYLNVDFEDIRIGLLHFSGYSLWLFCGRECGAHACRILYYVFCTLRPTQAFFFVEKSKFPETNVPNVIDVALVNIVGLIGNSAVGKRHGG